MSARRCAQEEPKGVQGVSDGWQSKIAAGGAPLANMVMPLPNGGCMYLDTVDTTGKRKDADFITQYLEDMFCTVAKLAGRPADTPAHFMRLCLGFVLDNTSTNHAAMRRLATKHHWLVNMGCQVRLQCNAVRLQCNAVRM
jgi:hypothetical protein